MVGKISKNYCRAEGASRIDSTSREADLHKEKQKRMVTMLGVMGVIFKLVELLSSSFFLKQKLIYIAKHCFICFMLLYIFIW